MLDFDVIRVMANVVHVDPQTTTSLLYLLPPTVSTHNYGSTPSQLSRSCKRPKIASFNQSMAMLPERVVKSALDGSASRSTSLGKETEQIP